MLKAALAAQGVDPSALDRALCNLAELTGLMAREYGAPPSQPWSPDDAPRTSEVTYNSDGQVDVRQMLGRPASRGHLLNVGSNDCQVVLEAVNGPSGAFTLKAGGPAVPVTFNLTKINVQLVGGKTATVQVYVQ